MKYDLFLSHASENIALAERIRDALTERGHSVWLDRTHLTAGAQWVAGIEAGLQECRAFALVTTREAMASRFVQTEYAVAVELAHDPERSLPLLPLLFENVKLPLILRSFQYVDFRRQEEFSQRVDELSRALSAKGVRTSAPPSAASARENDQANTSLKLRYLDRELVRQRDLLRQLNRVRAGAVASAPVVAVGVFFSGVGPTAGASLLLSIGVLMTIGCVGWGGTLTRIVNASEQINRLELLREGLSGCAEIAGDTCAEWRAQFWRLVPGGGISGA
jgi:TIR domain-containing protein